MPTSPTVNRRIVLAARPNGMPDPARDFRLEETPVPAPADGQFLARTLYLSLDPYMRGRMSDAPSYAAPVAIGEVITGETVSRVEASRHKDYRVGELVRLRAGWQDYAVSDGAGVVRLDPALEHPSLALGVLGMPGFTAYMGLLDIGQPKPGETVVVAAATGAVGAVVGQIAKLKGARVVGIAGGADKCRYAVDELGFNVCLDRHGDGLPARLKDSCPKGIDVYFENVGGAVFDAVFPLLNNRARMPVCGLISQYNTASSAGPDRRPQLMRAILTRSIRIQGFIIFDSYGHRHDEFARDMIPWVRDGKIKYREDVVGGLENAPAAFIGLLEGKNFGKLVVKVS